MHRKLLDVMTDAYILERESDPDVPDFSENVYFQPPSSVLMNYPAIVYERSSADTRHADNALYLHKCRYTVTVIDADPDSPIPRMVAAYRCVDRIDIFTQTTSTTTRLRYITERNSYG